jgi:molybdopterin synthase sulfur carrier subunit
MKVNFYATLRVIAGQKTIEIERSNGMTARELLEAVLVRFPEMQKELVDQDGNLFGHVHLFVNGRDSRFLENKLDTTVKPDDKIDFFPAVGGG